ncbi:Hypothetical protein, putative [Bodo saltans]|uniref:Uncharacterized protein n=1 Tax=Bodo saltans TaxID=75058 RepID=A0A0S4KGJ0_BODSA|nr:Hypothetical protein, putative [Bodo saltans]|eukprot:CUI14785.1 Hypothetical protein, putative [Bodo saltans]
MRYDRVLSAADRISTRRQLKPLSIKLVGTTPLDYDLLPELPSDDELDDNHDDPRIENYSCRNQSRYARWLRGSQKKEFKGKMCMYPSDHFGLFVSSWCKATTRLYVLFVIDIFLCVEDRSSTWWKKKKPHRNHCRRFEHS